MKTQIKPNQSAEKAPGPVEAVKVSAAEQIAVKPIRRWRARVFRGYLVTATVSFSILVVLASTTNYFTLDLTVTRAVQNIHAPLFADLMWVISYFGYYPQMFVLIAAVVVLLFIIGLRWQSVVVLISAAGSAGLTQLIKLFVHRPRPGAGLVTVFQQLSSYSFPSGHVLTYTAFFGFLFFLVFTMLKPSWLRALLLEILGILISLVGISRIYVGDHWASDVIGAYLLGSLWLVASIYVYQWGHSRFFVRQPLAPEKPKGG